MGENIAAIIRIYGARAIFLLFYDHQDTESESREIEISVAGPIFTHTIKRYMGQRYPYSKIREKILWQFFILMELEPFSYYFVSTTTLNLSHVK